MRSREQLSRTPGEYHDWRTEERRRILRELLAHLAQVRAERPEWFVWLTEGQPVLTGEEYAARTKTAPRRAKLAPPAELL